jgi:ABC-type branched-subunit amino acid transport system substrate-binding protein
VLVIIAAFALVATACGGGGGGSSAAATPTPAPSGGSQNALKVGAIVDLTGSSSVLGATQREGASYAVHEINGQGGINGKQLQVDYCDTRSGTVGGSECAQRFSSLPTPLVLGLAALPGTQGALPHLGNDLVPTVLPVLFPKAGTTVFQTTELESEFIKTFIDAMQKAHKTKVGVMYTTDATGTAQLDALKKGAGPAKITVNAQPMSPGATDVTTQLVQLRSAGSDVLFLATLGNPTNVILSSYHTLSMSTPVVVGAGAVTNGFLSSLQSSGGIPSKLFGLSNLALGSSSLTPAERTAWQKLGKDYRSFTGHPIDGQTASAYYATCVAAAVLKNAGPGAGAPAMASYLSSHPVSCLGANLAFNGVPGLNVVSGQPVALAEAGKSASQGWQPMHSGL